MPPTRCHPPVSQSSARVSASEAGWEALCRTAAAVRVQPAGGFDPHARRRRRSPGRVVLAGAMLGAALFAGSHLHGQLAAADATADSDLFSLTNQDRTSNGVAALADDPTLDSIGEAAPYSGCSGAGTIDVRAQDMINRDYFAHLIPPCNQYVWSMMSGDDDLGYVYLPTTTPTSDYWGGNRKGDGLNRPRSGRRVGPWPRSERPGFLRAGRGHPQ